MNMVQQIFSEICNSESHIFRPYQSHFRTDRSLLNHFENPTEVGQKLSEVSLRGIHAIFERLRHFLRKSTLDMKTQYMI